MFECGGDLQLFCRVVLTKSLSLLSTGTEHYTVEGMEDLHCMGRRRQRGYVYTVQHDHSTYIARSTARQASNSLSTGDSCFSLSGTVGSPQWQEEV